MKIIPFSIKKSGNVNLANYIAKMKNRYDIVRFLSSMRHTRLLKFLKFINNETLLNDGLMPLFLEILSASQVLTLTKFLFSIDRDRLYDEILSEHGDIGTVLFGDQVCFLFLKGLLILNKRDEAREFFDIVSRRYGEERFRSIINRMIRELSPMPRRCVVELEDSRCMFEFMTTIPSDLLWYIRLVNNGFSHSVAVQFLNERMSSASIVIGTRFDPFIMPDPREVDAVVFVHQTFPFAPAKSSSAEQQRQCLICQESESSCESDLRLLPCCAARCADQNDVKCICHDCIVKLSKHSNAEDPEKRFERGTHVICPNCRNKFPFFPQNS